MTGIIKTISFFVVLLVGLLMVLSGMFRVCVCEYTDIFVNVFFCESWGLCYG